MKNNTVYLIVSTIVFILLAICGKCTYQSFDDPMMILFASGAYTGEPSSYLIYSNVILGEFLSRLYYCFNSIEWYTIFQLLIGLAAANAIIYVIVCTVNDKIIKFVFVLMFILCHSYTILCMQYTFLASEVSLASFVLLFYTKSRFRFVAAYLLFIIAVLIRFESALIPYLILVPTQVMPVKFRSIQFRLRLTNLIILLLVSLSLYLYDKYCYITNDSWKYYTGYNNSRQYINDNPSRDLVLNTDLLSNDNKRSEYLLLKDYRVNDGTILSAEELGHISDFLKTKRMINIVKNIVPYIRSYKFMGFFAFILFVCVLIGSGLHIRNKKIGLIVSLVSFLFCNMYVMSRSVPKERVLFALCIPLIVMSVLHVSKDIGKISKNVIIGCLIGLSIVFIQKIYNYSKIVDNLFDETAVVNRMIGCTKESKIVFHNMVNTTLDAYHVHDCEIAKKLVRVGWTVNSPHTLNNYKGLVSYVNNNLPFIYNSSNQDKIVLMQKLLRDYYGLKTEIYTVIEYGDVKIVKIKKR